ncbi:AAA family ATPase [Massilia sp. SR12]
MDRFKGFSIFAENLKSFGSNRQGFEELKNVNLIVGRNNAGKSALIDLIQYAVLGSVPSVQAVRRTRLVTVTELSEADANFFSINSSGGVIGINHHDYGKRLVGTRVEVEIINGQPGTFISSTDNGIRPLLKDSGHGYETLVAKSPNRNPLHGLQFHRLAAERNVVPEKDNDNFVGIGENGNGATNLIQRFINKSDLPSELVEDVLLKALNDVFSPDAAFTRIVCQQHKDDEWEVYLHEAKKGSIALSSSGSGIKTVLLVLSYIHLLPILSKKPLSNYVFAFEELENNLHPALLRRLLAYIAEQSNRNGFPVFLTSHSGVAIDIFSRQKESQILHVTHDGSQASVSKTTTYVEHRGILDDLDLRASDLLQSNGIIWVEGPSDRIYLNSWIKLLSGDSLKEGVHYQCVFYGGRLLSHLSGVDMDSVGDAIPLLGINRNAAILIDSDKGDAAEPLNTTKNRIIREFEAFDGFVWVTDGREIENYISPSLIRKWLPPGVKFKVQKNKYESFFKYLNRLKAELGSRFVSKKPLLAEQMAELASIEDIVPGSELNATALRLCDRIRMWNRIAK